ncbi:hypothetical protein [Streptomyces griseus]|uniref:hypothetical protein n=1 Tax=Streptomyces griseus TaxID=1911 RepID=UPI003667F583
MDTSAAAQTANVTPATIRTWARRIAIGAMKRSARPIIYSIETMVAIGGNRWQCNGMDRVYFNNWATLAGIETTRYNTGNISSASYQGAGVSNSQAYKLLGTIDKVWFDAADGKIHGRYGYDESRVASRDEVWSAVITGIRTAIAAL